jgi:mannose/fructose/N-acetylgalactosamine-specific phosphotransferase system component IIB
LVKKQARFGGWVRIDDRLIHGQVTVGWRQYLRYREIWVVDDVVRDDGYLGDALRLAAPAGVEVRVMGLQQAVDTVISDTTSATAPVLMLLRNPEGVLALFEGGILLDRVNVGNLGARPGSVRAMKSVSLTQDQIAALDALAGQGIEVFFQATPEGARAGWEAVRRRLRS